MSANLPINRILTARQLAAWPGATIAGPGPYTIMRYRRFGEHHLALACQCADCSQSRATLRAAKRQLRNHHRRAHSLDTLEGIKQTAGRILADWREAHPCVRCGAPKRHLRCGLARGADGTLDRAAHTRRVASGKRFAAFTRARVASPETVS